MDKLDLLFRKLCVEYDEEFAAEGIVPTVEEFNEMADRIRKSSRYQYSDSEFTSIREQVRELRAASIGIVVTIDKPTADHDLEWYTHFVEDNPESCCYNRRFKRYMADAKHWSEDMIADLDRNTDEILNRIGDPSKGEKRKGLVIGDVQSGKTANYTSVCNKAIDAGYKIIIVLAGRTNTLRRQTQKRLESDFVGLQKDDANPKKGEVLPTITVGVGQYGKIETNCVEAFTSNTRDFSKSVADSHSIIINDKMMPKLFVVKKVKSVLDNLAKWLAGPDNKTIDVPMLLIDDEADDASVNTKEEDSPTAINSCIRRILKLFSNSTYLAITATPFANILINPYVEGTDKIDPDLFPDDFICCLPTPSNYIGSEKLFRDEANSAQVIPIDADDVKEAFPFKHKKTQDILELPNSLKQAIRYYAVSNAVRDILGHTKTHRSMMINVSRFVDVQNRLKSKVVSFWSNSVMLYIKSYCKMGGLALEYPEIRAIKKVFDESSIENSYGISWEQLQGHLFEANEKVSIVSVNQKSADSLDYEKYEKENHDGLRVIAIGGDCLSRGLTLEGLCVSYFYRNSQMYDTLMQMGRWFGYRPGYDKLIRVWMAEDAVSWYAHISEATELLKLEVYRMNRNKLTPLEFGYKICGHPDALIPTARAKMKYAKMDVKYAEVDVSGHLIECPRLLDNISVMKKNEDAACRFIKKISSESKAEPKNGDAVFRGVQSADVAEFIGSFRTLEWNFYFDSASLADGIREMDDTWNVCIKNGPEEDFKWPVELDNGTKLTFHAQKRKSSRTEDSKKKIIKVSSSKVKVGAGGCTIVGLESNSFDKVKKEWELLPSDLNTKKDGSGLKDIPDEFVLHYFDHPLLLIHFLRLTDEAKDDSDMFDDDECKVIALGLGFPSDEDYEQGKRATSKQKKIKVYLNTIAQQLEEEQGDDIVYEDL